MLGVAAGFAVFVVIVLLLRRFIRTMFIRAAEIFVLIAASLIVIVCATIGVASAYTIAALAAQFGVPRALFGEGDAVYVFGLALGLFFGFLIAAIFSALFFLLVEIAENTRRTAEAIERMAARANRPPG
jgi:hypothetical protein